MNWLLREKTDGRLTAGYLVYLLAGLAVAAAMILLHRRAVDGGASRRTIPGKASNVASITQSAAIMSPVEVAAKASPADAPSYRLGKPGVSARHAPAAAGEASPAAFNAIGAALAEGTPPGDADRTDKSPTLDEGGPVSRYAELAPALPPETAHRDRDSAQLLGYRDPAADAPSGDSGRGTSGPTAGAPEYFAPRGTLICVYLLTTVDTSNPAAVIQFAAAKSLFFNHRCQLPFGTRFLGKLSGGAVRDRINLDVDTVLYPDGLELPVSARAVEADETGAAIRPGVAADYVPPPVWVQAAPYASDFFTGAMGLLASRAQQSLAIGVGGVSVQTGSGGDLRAPLYQASAQAIQDFTQARLKELEQRYAGYYLVPAGSACWLQLDADLDLAPAHVEHPVIRLRGAPALPLSTAAAHASDVSN